MSCECADRMKRELTSLRTSARAQMYSLHRSLDAFQESIRQGANTLAAVHLYRAGVYLSAKESFSLEPSLIEILDSLERNLSENNSDLFSFFIRFKESISREDMSADKKRMLRGILRQKSKAVGLLSGRSVLELENARRALKRAEKTAERLLTWKEGIRTGTSPELICITDIHGSPDISQSNE